MYRQSRLIPMPTMAMALNSSSSSATFFLRSSRKVHRRLPNQLASVEMVTEAIFAPIGPWKKCSSPSTPSRKTLKIPTSMP